MSCATAWLLVIVFLGVCGSVAWIQAVAELSTVGSVRALRILQTTPSAQAFHDFERALDEESVVGQWLLPKVQAQLLALGAGNEQAYVDGDWLFFRPGVDYVTGPGFLDPAVQRRRALGGKSWDVPVQPDPIRAIVHFRDQLASRGIELIIVPTQVKAQTDPTERVVPSGQRADIDLQNPSFPAWWEAMAEEGIAVHYATSSEGVDSGFLRTDTHWTPVSMARNARSLASGLRELLDVEVAPVEREPDGRVVETFGDIATMLRIEDAALEERFDRDQVTIDPVANARTRVPDSEVLVLGDSFCNIYSVPEMGFGEGAGFVEHLSRELGRPVDRITINDGGAHRTRSALRDELVRGRDRLAGKRVVVWQFAIRELAVGDWQRIELPEVRARDEDPEPQQASSATPAHVRGRVVRRASVPSPGTVPYADCWIAVALSDVEWLDAPASPDTAPREDGGDVLLYVPGMRDNVWTSAARWQVGDQVEADLIPWEAGVERFGSFNREEIEGATELLLWTPFWGSLR